MLVLLMEMFRVKFKYQKTFNGRQGIQQMTETVFSLHVIPLFAGSYISCPSSTLSLMKIRAKNKVFFFKGNLTVFWHGCRDALFAHAHPQLSCLSSPLSHSICSRSLVLFIVCVFSFVVIASLTVTTFFSFFRERERELHGPKKRGPKPKNLVMKVQFFFVMLLHREELLHLKSYLKFWRVDWKLWLVCMS